MADTYKIQYDGMTLTYPGWAGYMGYEAKAFKTLTLYHSEGGTLTADTLTGYPGDTINLSTAYNTYWRFSGYQLTGDGTIDNNAYTFGTEDASICACYKVNAFTASGGFEGGDQTITARPGAAWTTRYFTPKYITASYKTSNVPTAWYATSNRWKVTSDVSAYSLTMAVKASFSGKVKYTINDQLKLTAYSFVGNSLSNAQTMNITSYTATASMNYNKSVITTTTGVNYGLSAAAQFYGSDGVTAINRAAGRTGTWVATGIIP